MGNPVRAYLPFLLAGLLCGCSASDLVENWSASPAPDLSQPNYRRIIADNIKTIFPKQDPIGDLEISGLRRVDHLRGPAWLACLKLNARSNPQLYAIFIRDSKIVDWRSARDRSPVECHSQIINLSRRRTGVLHEDKASDPREVCAIAS